MGRARRLFSGRRNLRHVGQVGVAGLPDLNRPVVDELRDDEESTGADKDDRRGAGGRHHPAGRGGRPHQKGAAAAEEAIAGAKRPEKEGEQRPQARPEPGPGSAGGPDAVVPGQEQRWIGALEAAIGGPIDLA